MAKEIVMSLFKYNIKRVLKESKDVFQVTD